MWLWHSCLSVTAPCDPQTWGQSAEWLAALVVLSVLILGFWAGFYLLLEWLWSRG